MTVLLDNLSGKFLPTLDHRTWSYYSRWWKPKKICVCVLTNTFSEKKNRLTNLPNIYLSSKVCDSRDSEQW